MLLDVTADGRGFLHSTLNIQLSTVTMHPLANLAKLLHKADFRDGL
jgi:hypothetical protein